MPTSCPTTAAALPQHTTALFMDIDTLHRSYDCSKNVTKNILNKYEKAKLLGMRMEQLARNAPPHVHVDGEMTPYEIAIQELKEGKLPFYIMRYLPNGTVEYWKVSDLLVPTTLA
jgi:DNA-directed RNA polymerase subunit K/omega